jgi:hypothetical protein
MAKTLIARLPKDVSSTPPLPPKARAGRLSLTLNLEWQCMAGSLDVELNSANTRELSVLALWYHFWPCEYLTARLDLPRDPNLERAQELYNYSLHARM